MKVIEGKAGNPFLTQTVTITLALKLGQSPYNPVLENGYNDLEHFFTDIGYVVHEMNVGEPE